MPSLNARSTKSTLMVLIVVIMGLLPCLTTASSYCASTDPTDPCTYYYGCGSSICVSCQAITDTTDISYLVILDDATTVCGSGGYDTTYDIYTCVIDDPFYILESYYLAEMFLTEDTLTQSYYCIDKDTYYYDASVTSICGDTQLEIEVDNIIEIFLDYVSIGCANCTVSGYYTHALTDIFYAEQFYIDNEIATNGYAADYLEYGMFYIRTCAASAETVSCDRTEYYNTTNGKCQLCSCKFDYCMYCDQTECLVYGDDLAYYTDYSNLIDNYCDLDPCVTYSKGTFHCEACPTFGCLYVYSTDSYECSYYSYLFVDSTTTVCSYAYTYDNNQRYCYTGDPYYGDEDYYHVSYNATASSVTSNVYCMACDIYNVYSVLGTDKCSDSCANDDPQTTVEIYINEYAIGCGVCASGFQYQQVIQSTFLPSIYLKTCSISTVNSTCEVNEYYDPYNDECVRCACKFTDCAACSYKKCVITYDDVIPVTNCTYTDPCLTYENDGTSGNCMECSDNPVYIYSTEFDEYFEYSYKLLIINSTTTVCATYGLASTFGLDTTNYICDVTDKYYKNETFFSLQYYAQGVGQQCIACDIYFTEATGVDLCADSCVNSGSDLGYLARSVASHSVGCGICAQSDYLMLSLTEVTFIPGVFISTCSANINGVYCALTEYYDSTTETCKTCSDFVPNCAACNSTTCQICADDYYYFTNTTYDYTTNSFLTATQCFFQGCPEGQGLTDGTQVCQDCNTTNCLACSYNSTSSLSYCNTCYKGYILDSDDYTCSAAYTDELELTYYIATGGAYLDLTSTLSDYYSSASGITPDLPYYFIQQALYDISQQSILNSKIVATIYIGKGNHFFYFCSAYHVNANDLTEYCDSTNYEEFTLRFLKAKLYTDDITLYVKALECSLASILEMTTNAAFLAMCVDLDTDDKPTIYINQPQAYFTLYGDTYFQNLKFSGINQYVRTTVAIYDISTLPLLYCDVSTEPSPADTELDLTKQTITSFPISFYCFDDWVSFNTIPDSTSSTFACERNSYKKFYDYVESTLGATGEPSGSNFFYEGDTFVEENSGIPPLRRYTLFDIQSLPDHQSMTLDPPSLTIDNCEFEYFLGGYESLINVDNIQIKNITAEQYYVDDDQNYDSESFQFYVYEGGERGIKLTITDSIFQHSSFSKGLVVYRKQPYIDDEIGFSNLTYLYMTEPMVQDTGSFIYLESSYFYNLNFITNVSALAIYGGTVVTTQMYDYLDNTEIDYEVFLHKGIVLNIEDFGGDIDISNCTFLANMHFIPEILITNHSSSIYKSVDLFKDSSISLEYKMSYCNLVDDVDNFFFQNGVDQSDDIDSYYDEFERLSLIYISRNRGSIMISSSNFTRNIGTFGGAISINSMNRQQDSTTSNIAIYDNSFEENMAYLSGNAIYIRMTKSETEYDQICGGGVLIKSNTFEHNIGMKAHNGGAVSAVCTYITSTHQDYSYASSESIDDSDTSSSTEIITSSASGDQYSISKYIFQMYDNTFTENYAGMKGTAVYFRMISYPQVQQCTFQQNGPVFSSFESLYSPYLTYYSDRTITYYDEYEDCLSEFAFLARCGSSDNYIDFSHVQGALYVEHCEESYCINSTNTMTFELINTKFKNNQAGPVLDEYFPSNLASQLFIQGGFSNYIYLVDFNSNDGLYYSLVKSKAQDLISYFPPDYFYSQSVPLISVCLDPDADSTSTVLDFTTNFTHCEFKDNTHYQVLGLTSAQTYSGSLINYVSEYGVSTSNFAPVLRVDNTYFYDNQFIGPSSSLIYVNNGILYFFKNTLSNNGKISSKKFKNPTIDLFDYSPFADYTINNAQKYGMILIQGDYELPSSLYHQIQQNKFTYTFSEFGSVYNMFLESQYVLMSRNIYSYKQKSLQFQYFYSFASKQGSILNGLGSISSSLIQMDHEMINYQFSYNGTLGITSYDSNTMSLILNNTRMYQFYASKASAINLLKAQKIIINNCIFKINSTIFTLDHQVKAGFAQMTNPLTQFIDTASYNLLVKTQTSSAKGSIYIDTVDGSSQNDFADILTQDSSDKYESFVEVYNTLFENLYAKAASVFYVSGSNMTYVNDINSNNGIYNCSHYQSGAIYIYNGGQFVGKNLVFTGMVSGSTASVLYISQESSAFLTNSRFANNYASGKGLTIVDGSSSLSLSSCSFSNNYAYDSSIIFADNNPSGTITIDNSEFENNTSSSNLFYMIFTTSTITNSNFKNNIAQQVNHGITITNSYLTLNNVSIHYTDESFLSDMNTKVETGFLNINFESNVFIKNSFISSTRGKTSGFLYANGQSNVTIDSNTIFQNCYSKLGSILYMSSTDQVSISNSQFINNTLQDISILNGNATLKKNIFSKGDEQFIYATSSSLEVIENTFQNGQNKGINGKAIFCNCLNFTVVKSIFKNLASVQGGALYLTSSSKSSVFYVHNNSFSNNEAQQGGAIFIQDGPFISLQSNDFIDNSANVIAPSTQPSALITQKGQGGAIYYDCLNTNVDLDGNCIVQIQKKNRFIQNSAQHDGGAIIWVTNDFTDDDTNEFDGNSANYGDDIGSYPKELAITFLDNGDYYNPVTNTRRLSESIIKNRILSSDGFSSLVSGTSFKFMATILDQQGNVYTADSSSVATALASSASTDVLFKYNVITAVKGVYDFTDLIAYTTPGTSFSLSLNIDGLTTYGNSISFIDQPLSVQVQFRNCVSGEELTSSNACVACANGTYSYFPPESLSTCNDCSNNAYCYGYNITTPKPGYWRANASSDSWVTCPRTESCLGGNMTSPTGICQTGYTGTACAQCEAYYSYSNYECTACPSDTKNATICAVILIFIFCYSAFLVRGTIFSVDKKKPLYSVYVKIMTNHFQIIGAISTIDFSWPTQIESFQSTQIKSSQVSTQLFNFDCLLYKLSFTDSVGTYYEKLMLYGISPIIFTLIAVLFWSIYYGIKRNFTGFKDHVITSIVVLLFLLHPSITTAMFSAFNCLEIDGIYYLKGDISSICYQGKHTFYIYIVILPSIIIWVIGIPLVALFCLIKNKAILKKSQLPSHELTPEEKADLRIVKLKYGFLFNGYQANYFYWEILIQYRKIFLIMSTVFLSVVSPESQVLVAMMIIIINMFAHSFNTPFYTYQLNQMELYSLQVATITMYCGLFYITGAHYTYMQNNVLKWFFLLFLIVPNIIYFGYWVIFMHLEFAKMVVVKTVIGFRIITCRIFQADKFMEKYMHAEVSPNKKKKGLEKDEDLKTKVKRVKKEVRELEKQGIILWGDKKMDVSSPTNSDVAQTKGLNFLEEHSQLVIGPDDVKLGFGDDNKNWKKVVAQTQQKKKKNKKAIEKYDFNFESDSNIIQFDSAQRVLEVEQNLKIHQDPSLHTKRIKMLFKQPSLSMIDIVNADREEQEISFRKRAQRFMGLQLNDDREETNSQAARNSKRAQRCLEQNSKCEEDLVEEAKRKKERKVKRYNSSEDSDLLKDTTPRDQYQEQDQDHVQILEIKPTVEDDMYVEDEDDIDERANQKLFQVKLK